MPSAKTDRLFNAIVILGAAMVAGCNGTDTPAGSPSGSGDSGGNGSNDSGLNFKVQKDAAVSDAGWTGW